jgi:hypothetical protein
MGLFNARTLRSVDSCALGADSARIPDLTIHGIGLSPIRRKSLPTLTPLIPCPGVFPHMPPAKFRSVTDEFQR